MKWYSSARVTLSESILIAISFKVNLDKNDIYPSADIHLRNKSINLIFLGDTKLFTKLGILLECAHWNSDYK